MALGAGDVDCGPVGGSGGPQLDAVAKASPAGVPGCTEVIDVLTEYLRRAPEESQGTARELTVADWSCSLADGTTAGCVQGGRTMQAAPTGASAPAAGSAPDAQQAPTAPLPASARPGMDGVDGVVDVGLITGIDTSGSAPVLVWDRISYQYCSGQPNCPDDYRTQNNNSLLRRYQVSPTAKVLLSDPDTPSAPARTATVADLEPYIGTGKIFIVAAGPDGVVSTIGQPYLP